MIADGQLVAAAEEERFNRVKYAAGFPAQAIRYCLREAGARIEEVDHITVPRNPWSRLGRKLFYAARMPRFALERGKVAAKFSGIRQDLARALEVDPARIRARFHRVEHHRAHLASAFFVSPFDQAAVVSADGMGDFASTMWATGCGNRIQVHGSIPFPHSLGVYYTALTQYLGFWKYGDEYKLMGLAAYGEPAYLDEFRQIVRTNGGLSFRLGLDYFLHQRNGPEMTWRDANQSPVLGRLFSPLLEQQLGPARSQGEPLDLRHHHIAATIQARLEESFFQLLNELHNQTGQTALCLAGGVAFNCVANGKVVERSPFEHLYVQPAAGDAGLALGSAYYVYHQVLGYPRAFVMSHAYWGPQFTGSQIRAALESAGCRFRLVQEDELPAMTASKIAEGKIVGWFQGRTEWGPRALGNRSILADPRRPEMKEVLNRRIKHREPFRPFAPSVLEEAAEEYFDRFDPSPFMTQAYRVRPEKRAVIPAPTHVDGTARVQTVSRDANSLYWDLIKAFERQTGVPALLNTSFNDNEPIVCTPEEAIRCFLRTRMDLLVLHRYLVEKPCISSY